MKRISKIDPDTLTGEAREIFEKWSPGGRPLNIVLIYFRNVELNRTWSHMAVHLFRKTSLSDRQREILVLRTSWQCKSDYEFLQHVRIAREGRLLTDEEMHDLVKPKPLLKWSESEKALIDLADELISSHFVSDDLWSKLERDLSLEQRFDAVLTVGGYTLNSMATNSYGVDLEYNLSAEPGLTPSEDETAAPFLTRKNKMAEISEPARVDLNVGNDSLKEIAELLVSQKSRRNFLALASHYSAFANRFSKTVNYTHKDNQLDDIQRLIIQMRTARLTRSEYGLQHARQRAKEFGFKADFIGRLEDCTRIEGDAEDPLLLLAGSVDDLMDKYIISEKTWAALKSYFSDEQIMDIVFLSAISVMIFWLCNAFRLPATDVGSKS